MCPAGFLHHGFDLGFDHPKVLIKHEKKEDKEDKEDEEDEVSLSEGSSRQTQTPCIVHQAVYVHVAQPATGPTRCCRSMAASMLSRAAVPEHNHSLYIVQEVQEVHGRGRRR